MASTAESFLANCLTDIIQIAQELKLSVDKIPQHRRKVRKLSNELLAGLVDIETFYNARRGLNILEHTPELADGLPNLLEKIKAAQERCEQLSTPTQSKGWRKLGAALKAWQECDQVEEEISELKDLAHVLYRKLTMSIMASIEDPTNNVDATTLVRLGEKQNDMIGHMESFLTTLQGSGTTPVFIQPSQDVINALYLHSQVETISNSLADLSTNQTFADEDPKDHYLAPFKPVISRPIDASSRDDDHREVVAKTLEIISLLKGDSADLSIQDGAWEMVNLAIKLYGLEMYSDAENMGRWTATMYRALVATNRAVYEPYLALSLRNLSRYKGQIKDKEGSTAAINESLDIQRHQVQENPTLENRSQLANTLCEYWSSVNEDPKLGLEIAKEAVSITESIRADLSTWNTWLESAPPPYIEAAYVQVEEAEAVPPPQLDDDETLWLDYNTARALCCLAYSLQDSDRIDEAYETELRSLAAYQALSERNGNQFTENMAGSYAHLASPTLRAGRPVDKSLEYAERAVEIYRGRVDVQPVKVIPWLLESLWDYASILHEAGRTEDVRRVTEEALELVRRSNKTQKLLADALYTTCGKLRKLECKQTAVDLRQEAVGIYRTLVINEPTPSQPESSASIEVIDSTTLPDTLMDLANDFVLVDKATDAVIACQEAVDIYRARLKENKGNADAHLDLARSISYLCYCTFVKKDYDVSMKLGQESITIYRAQYQSMGPDFKSVDNYISALRRTSVATFYSPSTHAISINAAVLEGFQTLVIDHKDKVGKSLLNCLHDRDFILGKYSRARESIPVLEQVLELCKPFPITDSAIAADFISASDSYCGGLFDIGRRKDCLLACQKAIDVGSSFSSEADIKAVALALANIRASLAAFLFNDGLYIEAEAAMKISLDETRTLSTPADDTLMACRLRTYAGVIRKLGRLEEALKLGEEAVRLCRASTSRALFATVRLPYNIESYAASVADSGDDERALVLVHESIKLYRQYRDGPYDPLAPWGYIEPIYCEALILLASCLMATGDSESAHQALTEAQTIYQGMIINKPAQLVEFMPCLDLLALNMRARGLLDEEKRISEDLDDRQRAVQFLYPELVVPARIGLEEFRSRPSQVRLRAKFPSQLA